MSNPLLPLSETEQRQWRHQHLETRLRALCANPKRLREHAEHLPDEDLPGQIAYELLFHAAWEGRHAAARWLIEFVGIINCDNGRPVMASERKKQPQHHFDITHMGGSYIDEHSEEARELADLWRAVTKATSHVTHESEHSDLSHARFIGAARIIASHVHEQIYVRHGESFRIPPLS